MVYLSFQISDMIDTAYAIAQEGVLPLVLLCVVLLFCLSIVIKALSFLCSIMNIFVVNPTKYLFLFVFTICKHIKQSFNKYQLQDKTIHEALHAPLEGERLSQGKVYAPSIYQRNKAQRKHLQ
ncbi:MAG: hypothetical protein MUC49_21165 [Raineya sp.]|jgi:hypothetical protein|nr:hypothetical protein [Raineya sp.]